MMLHIFTEEYTAKIVFDAILPKILPPELPYNIYHHQGKQDLEKALRKTLPSISKIPGSKILITRDQDNENCMELKNKLVKIINDNCHCDYLIRIVCKELESWFLGDLPAIKKAFPRFKPDQHEHNAQFRNIDMIVSPNRLLLKIIPEYSLYDNLPKLETSEKIAQYLDIDQNMSPSFNNTITAIKRLIE